MKLATKVSFSVYPNPISNAIARVKIIKPAHFYLFKTGPPRQLCSVERASNTLNCMLAGKSVNKNCLHCGFVGVFFSDRVASSVPTSKTLPREPSLKRSIVFCDIIGHLRCWISLALLRFAHGAH